MRIFAGVVLALVLIAGGAYVLPSTSLVRFLAPKVDLGDAQVLKDVRHKPEKSAIFDHSGFAQLLAEHVDSAAGRVDYAGLKKDQKKLDAYLEKLGAVDLKTLGADEKLALLINAYNAYTLQLILENYPGVKSIKDLKSPWKSKRYKVGGHTLSLDDIEHGLIRPVYKDSRIHFAVNCASIGCPPLQAFAFEGEKIDAQLDLAARKTLQDTRYVRIEGDKLKISVLLNWYGDDFIGEDYSPRSKTLAAYVARFGTPEVRAFVEKHQGAPSVGFIDYDWSLNDVK
ncbi:DUF547 domain-containing protein [Bradymonas sediminis]|uniref:DUF547 domain-containing protein n=1 Tax=Bradymonas sediminis TaxID=1548548 RepID=A0A2Z4FGN0_9DELT|nr:DUF547 domain-containing protein [Bradymonas sediminis]AWV88050.1 DUF547 domain-containing protein [Bradymonas sediminis]TDP77173.1 uncharacterized protein DUF547 [Bradymonas sediminis]